MEASVVLAEAAARELTGTHGGICYLYHAFSVVSWQEVFPAGFVDSREEFLAALPPQEKEFL